MNRNMENGLNNLDDWQVKPDSDEPVDANDSPSVRAGNSDGSRADAIDWLSRPEGWPTFIEFPSRRQAQAIRTAEATGEDMEGRPFDRDRVVAECVELQRQMESRAAQIDAWLLDSHAKRTARGVKDSGTRIDWTHVHKMEERLQRERVRKADGEEPEDGWMGIRWAVLLDPSSGFNDRRFANVALWGHGCLTLHDGGVLEARDDVITVPKRLFTGGAATAMAGRQAVLEAVERGWDPVIVTGATEFVQGAREAVLEAGVGATMTTWNGRTRTVDQISGAPPPGTEAPDRHSGHALDDGQSDPDFRDARPAIAPPPLAIEGPAPHSKSDQDEGGARPDDGNRRGTDRPSLKDAFDALDMDMPF